MFSGNHIPLPPEWARLRSKLGTRLHCSIFGLLMSEAVLTSNLKSLSWPWSLANVLLSSWTQAGKTESSNVCPLQEFAFYWILSTSIFLFFIPLLCHIQNYLHCIASLLFSKYTAERRGKKPALLKNNSTKDMMFHFYDKCKFSTNRQIPHFQWLRRGVLRYRIPTNQV